MESVPPQLYGGTERDRLLSDRRAGAAWATRSPCSPAAIPDVGRAVAVRADGAAARSGVRDPIPYYMLMLDRVRERPTSSTSCISTSTCSSSRCSGRWPSRTLTTLHGRQDLPDLRALYLGFRDMPLVSISEPSASRCRTRISPPPCTTACRPTCYRRPRAARRLCGVSRPHLAGEAARSRDPDRPRARHPAQDRRQGRQGRRGLFPRPRSSRCWSEPGVEFIGEINEREKQDFSAKPRALLFPIDWPEPFGLVMIEAMACGTPVLAFRCGSVPEVIDDGVTGMIVDTRTRRSPRCRACWRSIGARCGGASSDASPPRGWPRIT